MKKFLSFLVVLSIHVSIAQSVTVNDVIEEINQPSIENYVQTLQNFGTRFMLSPKRFEAAAYIKGEFESMGFTDVKLDSFQCRTTIGSPYFNRTIDTTTTQVNVVATLQGSITPGQIYIICGHYDSFCTDADPFNTAPGADDDASGTVAVMESARAIMSTGFVPKSTLRFIAFAAEELMFFGGAGSEYYAARAYKRNDDIKLVINNDMIGYTEESVELSSVNIGYTDGFSDIDKVMQLADNYSSIICNKGGYNGADLITFSELGYDGVYFEEALFNSNNYHKSTDKIININLPYLTEVIKAATAVLIGMDDPATDVEDKIIPMNFTLEQNYPNPFNPATRIKFAIPRQENVDLMVYDILGRKVAELVNETLNAGNYNVNFDGSTLSSGMYVYKITAGSYAESKKMLMIK